MTVSYTTATLTTTTKIPKIMSKKYEYNYVENFY